jgi:hypothetical protein
VGIGLAGMYNSTTPKGRWILNSKVINSTNFYSEAVAWVTNTVWAKRGSIIGYMAVNNTQNEPTNVVVPNSIKFYDYTSYGRRAAGLRPWYTNHVQLYCATNVGYRKCIANKLTGGSVQLADFFTLDLGTTNIKSVFVDTTATSNDVAWVRSYTNVAFNCFTLFLGLNYQGQIYTTVQSFSNYTSWYCIEASMSSGSDYLPMDGNIMMQSNPTFHRATTFSGKQSHNNTIYMNLFLPEPFKNETFIYGSPYPSSSNMAALIFTFIP